MAANWLRNIQGQLTDLATEVLTEVQNEVEDPESELQVEKKRSAEFERLLKAEKTRTAELDKTKKDLTDQLYSCNLEMDGISVKFQNIVEARDQQIRTLKSEVEQLQHRCEEGATTGTSADSLDHIKELRAELDHWKKVVKETDSGIDHLKVKELEKKLEDQKCRQQAEISALITHHQQVLADEREHFESRLAELEGWGNDDVTDTADTTELTERVEQLTAELKVWEAKFVDEEKRHEEELKELRTMITQQDDSSGQSEDYEMLRAELKTLKDKEMPEMAKSEEDSQIDWEMLLEDAMQERDKLKEELNSTQDECKRLFTFVSDKIPKSSEDNPDKNVLPEELAKKLGRRDANDIEDKDAEIHHLRMEVLELLRTYNELNDEFNTYKEAHNSESSSLTRDFTDRIDSLKSSLIEYEERYEQCKRENAETVAQLEKLTADFEKLRFGMSCATTSAVQLTSATESQLSAEIEHLKGLLKESMDDKEKVIADAHNSQSTVENKVSNLEDRLANSNQELALSFEEKEKLIEELRRLREQLVMVEDTSRKEAVAAEERETQLRRTVRLLEEKTEAATDTVASSSNQYQLEIAELSEKLQSRESELEAIQSRLLEREKSLADTSEALSNLQAILKDLSTDHENKLATYEQEMGANEARWNEEKRLVEDTLAMRNEELCRKDDILKELENQIEELRRASAESSRQLTSTESQFSAENEHLKGLLKESMDDKEKVIADAHNFQSTVEKKISNLEDRLAKSNQELGLSFEEKERLIKELRRLREHLVMMEETSTKEAVAAEERETQLRRTVRLLEEKTEAATDTVVSSSNQYQLEIAELSEKLQSRETELEAVQSRLFEREKSLSDTSKALSNLQVVLKDLSTDHEKELATYEQEMDGLRDDIKTATINLNALRANEAEWDEEKRFIEDTVAMQKEEMCRKDKILEELENQIEELRHASAESSRSSHRIDDSVLRQLFLSYFTAPKDKQGEIAVLLASILEYPQEDVATIQNIVQQNSRSWFSWMGAGSAALGAPSITEQFIRFLEHESLAVRQQTALPVESTAVRLPLEDSMRNPQSKSSSDDLKSILES